MISKYLTIDLRHKLLTIGPAGVANDDDKDDDKGADDASGIIWDEEKSSDSDEKCDFELSLFVGCIMNGNLDYIKYCVIQDESLLHDDIVSVLPYCCNLDCLLYFDPCLTSFKTHTVDPVMLVKITSTCCLIADETGKSLKQFKN